MMISNMVKCISEDFLNFTNLEYLQYDDGDNIINTYYNFIFNHETPTHTELYNREKWEEGPNHFMFNKFFRKIYS